MGILLMEARSEAALVGQIFIIHLKPAPHSPYHVPLGLLPGGMPPLGASTCSLVMLAVTLDPLTIRSEVYQTVVSKFIAPDQSWWQALAPGLPLRLHPIIPNSGKITLRPS